MLVTYSPKEFGECTIQIIYSGTSFLLQKNPDPPYYLKKNFNMILLTFSKFKEKKFREYIFLSSIYTPAPFEIHTRTIGYTHSHHWIYTLAPLDIHTRTIGYTHSHRGYTYSHRGFCCRTLKTYLLISLLESMVS
jgi:hypothetical protein